MNGYPPRPERSDTLEQRRAFVASDVLACDCAIPVPNLTPWFGLIPGDCCTCKRPIRKDNP